MEQDNFTHQFKSLDDLQKIIEQLIKFAARPVTRGSHPTLYPKTEDGPYRTIEDVRIIDYKFSTDEKWVLQGADLPKNMQFVEDKDPKKKDHYFLTVTESMSIYKLVSNLKWIADRMTAIRNAERAL